MSEQVDPGEVAMGRYRGREVGITGGRYPEGWVPGIPTPLSIPSGYQPLNTYPQFPVPPYLLFPVDRMKDNCENITFSQLLLRAAKMGRIPFLVLIANFIAKRSV